MQDYIKLSEYARKKSITYKTAWNHFNQGIIEGAIKDNSGHVLVPKYNDSESKTAIIYARVSSNDRKKSLTDQQKRLEDFAMKNGYQIVKSYKEIASGMNDDRKVLNKILSRNDWNFLIVENRDRLTRFGFNYIRTLLNNQNKDILVLNKDDNDNQDLMKDLISIIYSFSARLYGLRRRKNREEICSFLDDQKCN